MTSLPKTMAKFRPRENQATYVSFDKVLVRAIQKKYFLLNLNHCAKRYGHLSNFFLFYHDHSPDMVMSHDSRWKFIKKKLA